VHKDKELGTALTKLWAKFPAQSASKAAGLSLLTALTAVTARLLPAFSDSNLQTVSFYLQ